MPLTHAGAKVNQRHLLTCAYAVCKGQGADAFVVGAVSWWITFRCMLFSVR